MKPFDCPRKLTGDLIIIASYHSLRCLLMALSGH